MSSLKQVMVGDLKIAQANLKRKEQNLELLNILPKEISEYDWGENIRPFLYDLSSGYEVCLGIGQNQDALDRIKDYLGKECGFAFERVGHVGGSNFYFTGKFEGVSFNGKQVRIQIDNAPKPENCTLIGKKVTREVVEYEAICNETNKKL